MDWNVILTELLKAVIGIAVPVVAVFACRGLVKLAEYLKAKTQNVKTKQFIDEISTAITSAVAYVSQTLVSDLKKQGKFDKEAALLAFNTAYNTAIATISDSAIEYLENMFGDPRTYITAKIEEAVKYQHDLELE